MNSFNNVLTLYFVSKTANERRLAPETFGFRLLRGTPWRGSPWYRKTKEVLQEGQNEVKSSDKTLDNAKKIPKELLFIDKKIETACRIYSLSCDEMLTNNQLFKAVLLIADNNRKFIIPKNMRKKFNLMHHTLSQTPNLERGGARSLLFDIDRSSWKYSPKI